MRLLRVDWIPSFGMSTYPFTEYFKGFEKVKSVKELFGERTEEVLRSLKVQFVPIVGYMAVSNRDGRILISNRYLNNGDRTDVYLDVIHELVHVKQFMQGKELFDVHYGYTERPTEIEAYRYAVDEARNLGLSDDRICDYLKTEWMSNQDLRQLARILNVKCQDATD